MNTQRIFKGNLGRQGGMATILMVLLVGVSISAMSAAILLSVRSSQDKQVAAQAQIHAQAAVWTQAEHFRRYFAELTSAELLTLKANTPANAAVIPPTLGGMNRVTLAANVLSITTPATGNPTIAMELTARDLEARATSKIAVLYELAPFSNKTKKLKGEIDFNKGLHTEGQITFIPEAGVGATPDAVINVNGNADYTATLGGVFAVNATGNLNLASGGVSTYEAFANGNITINDAKVWRKATARGSITTTKSGCVVGSAYANQLISLACSRYASTEAGWNNNVAEVKTRASATILSDGLDYGLIVAGGTATLGGAEAGCTGACFDRIESVGALTLSADRSLTRALSADKIKCPNASPNSTFYTNLSIADAPLFDTCPANPAAASKLVVNATPSIQAVAEIQAIDLTPIEVNTWNIAPNANYVVRANGGKILVTVKNVAANSGAAVPDGEYKLDAITAGGPKDYLCLDAAGLCGSTSQRFCTGGASSSCLVSSGTQFTLDGTIVPGVILFQGDLLFKRSNQVDAIVASIYVTGNVKSEGTFQLSALNFAGLSGFAVAARTAAGNTYTPEPVKGVCSGLASGLLLKPSNFCVGATYVPGDLGLGNIGLMAGGRNPANAPADGTITPYSGGNIWLASSSRVFGTVMAGNYLATEGGVWIKGNASASVLGSALPPVSTTNHLSSQTLIDGANLPEGFKKDEVPNTDTDGSGANGGGTGHIVKMTNARYL